MKNNYWQNLAMCSVAVMFFITMGMSSNIRAQIPEHDIITGRTIDVPRPMGLVYRDDGFWVVSNSDGIVDAELQHYSYDGVFLAAYNLPGPLYGHRPGIAWDGNHWWLVLNSHAGDRIYKLKYDSNGDPNVLLDCPWNGPGSGPNGIEYVDGGLYVSENHTDVIVRDSSVGESCPTFDETWSLCPVWGWEPWGLAWDGCNIWSLSGPAGGGPAICNPSSGASGLRQIYKHDAVGNIIEIWNYPPAGDPGLGIYGGFGTGVANIGNQSFYCDYDQNKIIGFNVRCPILLSPNGGEELIAGSGCAPAEITWNSSDFGANVVLEYSTNSGITWTMIDTVINTGSYLWEVPFVDSNQCLIKISDQNNTDILDISDMPFTIVRLIADFNGDCEVNLFDFTIFCTQWLKGNPIL